MQHIPWIYRIHSILPLIRRSMTWDLSWRVRVLVLKVADTPGAEGPSPWWSYIFTVVVGEGGKERHTEDDRQAWKDDDYIHADNDDGSCGHS